MQKNDNTNDNATSIDEEIIRIERRGRETKKQTFDI
jgi:hypothetical protein